MANPKMLMATIAASPSPQLSTTSFPPSRATFPLPKRSFTVRATTDDNTESSAESKSPTQSATDPDPFESRLSQVRFRYRSGTGKKAELRKSRKGVSKSGPGMYLPPVPLKEPVSGGLKVEFGFSPYSERVNGRIAILGLAALILVELATGESVINYHTPAIVLIQIYFVAAVTALYVKYEKEKVSVWPQSSSPSKE